MSSVYGADNLVNEVSVVDNPTCVLTVKAAECYNISLYQAAALKLAGDNVYYFTNSLVLTS